MCIYTERQAPDNGCNKIVIITENARMAATVVQQSFVFVGSTRVNSNMLHLQWINQTDTANPNTVIV